jgi:hypothetical protein
MTVRAISLAFVLAWFPLQTAAAKDDLGCGPWRAFVASVLPGETRSLAFRTSWGSGFKDQEDPSDQFLVMSAKRCEHNDYGPAQSVCAHLMEHGAVEFSDWNFKDAVTCLSRKTRLDPGLSFNSAAISLSYGTDDRGANVDLEFVEDSQVGGMVLKVTAAGY